MDPRMELGTMGPPPAVAHPSNSKAEAPPLPASPNARTAATPRRIIKTINLDFNKLKEAGLDRKLAEVLSKQNPGARAGITSSSSSSSSFVATQSTSASTSTATATATVAAAASTSLHSQQQKQLHQPELPQPLVRRIQISEYVEKTVPLQPPSFPMSFPNSERSMHVKTILKNRILNKSITQAQQRPLAAPRTPPAAAQGSAGTSNAAATEALSIPKADLSVRPKHPPLLLNLVNQLPKHRAMCRTNDKLLRTQQEQLQQKAFERPPPQQHISRQQSLEEPQLISVQDPPQPPSQADSPDVLITFQKSPSPPLIVLENKVLAPNEKIDLNDLRLPSSATKVGTILATKSQSAVKTIKGKVIMNASKFKVSRERLAEMAKEIRNQAKQVELNTQTEAAPPARDGPVTIKKPITKPAVMDPKQQPSGTSSSVQSTKLTSLKAKEFPNLNPSDPAESSEPMSDGMSNQEVDSSWIDLPMSSSSPIPKPEQLPKPVMSTETSFLDLPQSNPKKKPLPAAVKSRNTSSSSQECPGSALTRERGLKSSEAASKVPKVQSAVDFIAQLTAAHSLDENSFMELSPEEQRLNALFGGSGGCSFTGVSPQKSKKEVPEEQGGSSKKLPNVQKKQPKELSKPAAEEELPIGKIVKMDDMNILHATLDVNSGSTNILRISPNAIKLSSSVVALDKPIQELTEAANVADSLAVATPNESPRDEQPVIEVASKGTLENQTKPVPDSEPVKEVNPPAKRVPLRSKKAKINLVQRSKRPSIPSKPVEAKKTKLDDVEGSDEEATAALIGPSLLEEDGGIGVKAVEVPADAEQEARESTEDKEQGARESKEDKEQEVRESNEDEEQRVRKSAEDDQQKVRESNEDEYQRVRKSAEDDQQKVRESKEDKKQGVRESKDDKEQEARESKDDKEQEARKSTEDEKQRVRKLTEDEQQKVRESTEVRESKEDSQQKVRDSTEDDQQGARESSEAGEQRVRESTEDEQQKVRDSTEDEQQGARESKEDKKQGARESTDVRESTEDSQQKVRDSTEAEQQKARESSEAGEQRVRESTEDEQQKVRDYTEDEEQRVRESTEDSQQKVRDSTEDDQQAARESIEDAPKEASSPAKDTNPNSKADNQNAAQSTIERNLTQLYHPPKMPKTKPRKKNSKQEALEQSQPAAAPSNKVSLLEILSQEQPPAQGYAKLPFRKESAEVNPPESTGIQSLITLLTAENISPSQTKKKSSPTPPSSEETTKTMARKKRVRTRPALSKRSFQKQEELATNSLEFLHPISANVGGGRIPTSSTSDDDGAMFLGFDNDKTPVRSKRVRQMKINETDISDDATPDYDETEEELQPTEPKTPVDLKFFNRLQKKAYDSDSSDYPMDFADNSTIEDTSCDKTSVITETKSTEKINWEDLKGKSKEMPSLDENLRSHVLEPILDPTIVTENQQKEALNEQEQPESVIDERNASIGDKKSRRSRRKSKKPSPRKELEIPAIEIKSEEPSTSKNNTKTSKAQATASRKHSTSKETTEGSIYPKTVEDEETSKQLESADNSVFKESHQEVKVVNKSKTFVKSKGKRKSLTPKHNVTFVNESEASGPNLVNADSEQKEGESKILEELKEATATEETPQSRISPVSEPDPVINKEKEEQPIESTISVKPKRKRASRSKTKPDSHAQVTELAETPSAPVKPIATTKPKETRKSRSKTPKIPLPPVAETRKITKSEESNPNTNSQREQDEVKDTEEPNPTKNSGRTQKKRKSRSRKSDVPPVAKDDIKLYEKTENTDSEKQPEEVKAAEEPDDSLTSLVPPKPKRQSRSKTPKISDSVVTKNNQIGKLKSSRLGSQEESKVAEEQNQGLTTEVTNVFKPATEDVAEPLSSVKSKRNRKPRSTPKSVPIIVPADDKASIDASLADSQPAVVGSKRTTSSRLSLVPPDTAAAPVPAPKEEVIPDSVPKREGKSSAASQPKNLCEASVTGAEVEPKAAAPKRGRKRAAPSADTESSEASKKLKTEIKKEPGEVATFNTRLLLIRQREQLDSEEVLTDEGSGKGPLQCGLCLGRSSKEDWLNHRGKHYGVGWFVGETPEVTRNWVLKTMKKYVEESRKTLTCRLCQQQLGSNTGMMLHLESCGNRQRVECDQCKKSYAKLSIAAHRKACLGQQKRKVESVGSFNLRLLLIRKREQLDSEEVLTEEGKGTGPLQCGLCLARSNELQWQTHLEEHYGVGWLVGETPTNITRNWLIQMMKAFLLDSKKKLICRLCDRQLGSALGMMLHLENCGNKQRVECKICQKSYTVLTFAGHLRICAIRLQAEETSGVKAEEDASETVYSNAGRTKRKSTIKAETQLKKIGEDLSSQAPEETTVKHEFNASDSSEYDMAQDKESSEEYDSEGVDSNEDCILAEQQNSDGDKSKRSRQLIRKKRPVTIGEHATKPMFLRDVNQEGRANRWTEFVQFNYSSGPLYSQLVVSYSMLSSEEASRLLPSKDATSMRYAYGKVREDSEWKRLAPLEGFNKKREYLGYLGGSVKQLAWAPLPSKVTDQYLLCSVRPKMRAYARHAKLKHEDALLMLLKCTEGSSQESWSMQPRLHYGIRVPNGPVHSFAFLPSGGYDQSLNRLGLLAVANASSEVHIYALPLEIKNEEKCEENLVIQLDAVITLSLDVDQPFIQDQCTRICWSEASGHNFLASGYASGRVAFWDIGDTESINCFRRNNDQVFVPSNTLFLSERNIQFMELHYDINGPRWLAVGTLARQFMVYDIMNWAQTTPLKQNPVNNLYLATMTWSPISEAVVLSSTPDYSSRAILFSPAGVEFDYRTLDGTLTASRSMHTNCQQNHMVLATDLGDLAFLAVKDLSCAAYMSKTMVRCRAISTSKLHHLGAGKPSPKESISADEFLRDYGVKIHPLVESRPQPLRTCPYLSEKRRPSNPQSLSLTRVNSVRCNWNSSAHTWVAMGAEHGLLRILNFKRNKFF